MRPCVWEQGIGEGSGLGGTKDIFAIKNQTQEEGISGIHGIAILAFRAIQNALHAACDYLQDQAAADNAAPAFATLGKATGAGPSLANDQVQSQLLLYDDQMCLMEPAVLDI